MAPRSTNKLAAASAEPLETGPLSDEPLGP